jgi:hypothetical protein
MPSNAGSFSDKTFAHGARPSLTDEVLVGSRAPRAAPFVIDGLGQPVIAGLNAST